MKRIGKLIRGGNCQVNLQAHYEGMTDEELTQQRKDSKGIYVGLYVLWFSLFIFLFWQLEANITATVLFTSFLPIMIISGNELQKKIKLIDAILKKRQS